MTTSEKIVDTVQVFIIAIAVVAVIGGFIYALYKHAERSDEIRLQRYELCLNEGGVTLDRHRICVWGGGPVR